MLLLYHNLPFLGDRIRVFHVHSHFSLATETRALRLHQALMSFVTQKNKHPEALDSKRVWWGKNGPHQKWSWEIHVTDENALARAVVFLMANKIPENSALFHPRTRDVHKKNEYNDHAHRLTWIGVPDPEPLDVDFFKDW